MKINGDLGIGCFVASTVPSLVLIVTIIGLMIFRFCGGA